MDRAGDDRTNDDLCNVALVESLKFGELEQPYSILVTRPARVGCYTPARLYLAPFDQRENNIRISDIGSEQHRSVPFIREHYITCVNGTRRAILQAQ